MSAETTQATPTPPRPSRQKVVTGVAAQGASELNLGVMVAEADLRAAVESPHAEFFSTLDPAVTSRECL